MRRAITFLGVLLSALALLALAGYAALTHTTSLWFQHDLDLRSQLAVAAARQSLTHHWQGDVNRLGDTLTDITRDERIMAAAACSKSGIQLAATDAYPERYSCETVLSRMRHEAPPNTPLWSTLLRLPGGPVKLSVNLLQGTGPVDAVVLVHDLSYLERREATTRRILLAAFFVLAVLASCVTLLALRLLWRRWTEELQQALSGQPIRQFQPLVRDVRLLVDRVVAEQQREARFGAWSPARLRSTLIQYLHGERVVILANREPYIHEHTQDGIAVLRPASGLVTALEPVVRACSGVWVGHGAGS